ncbi:MAG TPA: hypothetical protein VFB59_01130 [Candidatus Saccharimonadales bacterium]|nr:hypothetical protein [Candidatus Saccharimonadales bacterium]
MRRLHTNKIVGQRYPEQAHQLRQLVRGDVVPKLLVLRDTAGAERPDIRSYTAALREQMRRVHRAVGYVLGGEVTLGDLIEVKTAPTRDLRHLVKDANGDPSVDSVLVMSPVSGSYSYEKIVAELSPDKDVDGMNPDSGRMPRTPLAIQQTLDHHDLWLPDRHFTLVGRGRTVNSYVDEALLDMMGEERYNDQVRVITKSNQDELGPALQDSEVAIVAAGVHNQITPELIGPNMRAVVGVCIGDIHPDVRRIKGDLLVTPPHLDRRYLGIGAVTASNAIQGTLDAAMSRLPGLS